MAPTRRSRRLGLFNLFKNFVKKLPPLGVVFSFCELLAEAFPTDATAMRPTAGLDVDIFGRYPESYRRKILGVAKFPVDYVFGAQTPASLFVLAGTLFGKIAHCFPHWNSTTHTSKKDSTTKNVKEKLRRRAECVIRARNLSPDQETERNSCGALLVKDSWHATQEPQAI